jgi:DNA uptake protein ComE-like DNA-binding protein
MLIKKVLPLLLAFAALAPLPVFAQAPATMSTPADTMSAPQPTKKSKKKKSTDIKSTSVPADTMSAPQTTTKSSKKKKSADTNSGDTKSGAMQSGDTKSPSKSAKSTTVVVNINTDASDALQQVKGIGDTTAKKIIAGRPYTTLDDLVTKKVITANQLAKFKTQLSVK